MNDINRLKREHSEKHPAFGSYLECSSRGLLTGLASFTLGFSATYIGQSLLRSSLPYGKNGILLCSSCVAVALSYHITSRRMQACQAAWLAAEDKHTYLSGAGEEAD